MSHNLDDGVEELVELVHSILHSSVKSDLSVTFKFSPVVLLLQVMADLSLFLASQTEEGWSGLSLNPRLKTKTRDEWPNPKSSRYASQFFEAIVNGPEVVPSRRIRYPPDPQISKFFRDLAHWCYRYSLGDFHGHPKQPVPSETVFYHQRRRNRRRFGGTRGRS